MGKDSIHNESNSLRNVKDLYEENHKTPKRYKRREIMFFDGENKFCKLLFIMFHTSNSMPIKVTIFFTK